jgi:hypothetical protein
LKAFLANSPDTGAADTAVDTNVPFIWETHTPLRKISLQWIVFDIATSFPKHKGRGNSKKLGEVFTVKGEGGRSVCFRRAEEVRRIHVGYDPEFKWVERVEREMRGVFD